VGKFYDSPNEKTIDRQVTHLATFLLLKKGPKKWFNFLTPFFNKRTYRDTPTFYQFFAKTRFADLSFLGKLIF